MGWNGFLVKGRGMREQKRHVGVLAFPGLKSGTWGTQTWYKIKRLEILGKGNGMAAHSIRDTIATCALEKALNHEPILRVQP